LDIVLKVLGKSSFLVSSDHQFQRSQKEKIVSFQIFFKKGAAPVVAAAFLFAGGLAAK
jgi:hypothetical protein